MQKNKIIGGALLTALFIMTLVAIVATAMSTRFQIDVYRTRLMLSHDKLYLMAQPVLFWSLDELEKPQLSFNKVTSKGMIAHFPEKLISEPNVHITGELYDLQTRFNLNNLAEKKNIAVFLRLLSANGKQLTAQEQLQLAVAVKNWLSPYDLATGKDSYTNYYLSLKPPYFPSHQLMNSLSELRLVKDVSANLYNNLQNSLVTLPESTPININTAPKNILQALGNGLNDDQVNEIISMRGDQGIKDLNLIGPLLEKMNLPREQITLESNYFLSAAYVSNEDLSLVVFSLIKRERDKKKQPHAVLVRQAINTY
jgi:general secretion pathway protein K